jgi:hypothetical protein
MYLPAESFDRYVEVWFSANSTTRFRGVRVRIPIEVLKVCIDVWNYDKHHYIFVYDKWLQGSIRSHFSAFLYVDAAGVQERIEQAPELIPKRAICGGWIAYDYSP